MTVLQRSEPVGTPRVRDLGVVLTILGVVALLGWSQVGLVLAIAVCAFPVFFLSPALSLAVATVLVFGLPYAMSEYPIPLGGFKLYGIDFVIALYASAIVRFLVVRARGDEVERGTEMERAIRVLVIAFTIYGGLLALYGIFVRGYSYDAAFGDFRRYFFYPLILLIPLETGFVKNRATGLNRTLLVGAIILATIGVFRVVMGNPVRLDIDLSTGYTGHRMMAVVEFCVGAMALAYLTSRTYVSRSFLLRIGLVVLAAVLAALLLRSGYRLALVFAVFAPAFGLICVVWLRRDNMMRLLLYFLVLGAAGLTTVVAIAAAMPDQVQKTIEDFNVRSMDGAVTGDYRDWAWRQAYGEFRASPIIGTGLGHKLVFLNRTRAGMFEHKQASAHSSLVTILYRSGIVGFSLFVLVHVVFIACFLRYGRRVAEESQALLAGLFAGYLCVTLASFTQPLHVAGYAAGPLMMGYVLYLLRPRAEPEEFAR